MVIDSFSLLFPSILLCLLSIVSLFSLSLSLPLLSLFPSHSFSLTHLLSLSRTHSHTLSSSPSFSLFHSFSLIHSPTCGLTHILALAFSIQPSETASFFYEIELPVGKATSIEDCLSALLAPEQLEGANRYHCGRCDALQDATRQLLLDALPDTLNLQLMRCVQQKKRG